MNSPFTLHPCEASQKMSDAAKLRNLAYKNAGAIEKSFAQNPHFSQYFTSPMTMNPAFAGVW